MTVDLKVETIIGHELGLKNLKKYKFTYIYGYVSIFMYLHICTFICMLMIMLNIKIRQNKTTIMVLNQKKKNFGGTSLPQTPLFPPPPPRFLPMSSTPTRRPIS